MNELMLFGTLSAQRTEAALLRGNAVTERFGLTLTPEQCGRLLERRAEALRETERIELGEGILPKLAVALCDSPCVGPENWEEALGGLTELFYHFKGACGYTTAGRAAAQTASPISMAARCCALHARERWGTMANELTCPLTGAEERLWQEKLAALLVRQIALYTANESSSVPTAAAQELLRGVLFFLAVPEEPDGGGEADRAARIRTLLSCDLANALTRTLLGGEGLTLSDGEIDALRERWKHARPERIENDLLTAADALAERLALPRGAGKYLSSCAREVAVRAESLRDCGGLRGVFV